jgi:hypothetical protein
MSKFMNSESVIKFDQTWQRVRLICHC